MGKKIDITGMKFNRLSVIGRVNRPNERRTLWECVCDCGNHVIAESWKIRNGYTKSCGCYKNDMAKLVHLKHGLSYSRINKIYRGMKYRCYNKKSSRYEDYGGRGISICDEWLGDGGFERFYEWSISHGYSDELTIDRIDTDGSYSPDNCKWSSMDEQANNKRRSVFITAFGERHTIADWSRKSGINYTTLYRRIVVYKWDAERAISGRKDGRYTKNERYVFE